MLARKATIIRRKDMFGTINIDWESVMVYFDIKEPEFSRNANRCDLVCVVSADSGKGEAWVKEHFPEAEIEIVER